MNRNDIGTAVRNYLNEVNVVHITGTIMTNAINRACVRLNRECKLNRVDATTSIKSGAREVSLSGTIIEIYRARLGTGSQRVRLKPTSLGALDRDNDDWEAGGTGTPDSYYVDGGVIGYDPQPITRTAWVKETAYAVGDIVIPNTADNGMYYTCVTAGTSAATHPATWTTTISGTTAESTGVVWQQSGATRVYLKTLQNVGGLTASQVPTWCPPAYHDTIAKLTAIDLAGGWDADNENQAVRHTKFYQEYLAERRELKEWPMRRSREYTGRVSVSGYGTFKR